MNREPREVRNKRIAIEAVTLLERIANDEGGMRAQEWARYELEQFRQRWEARGVKWLRPPREPFDPDEWLSAPDMAERSDVKAETVRRWHLRGHITAITNDDGGLLFNVGEVNAYLARRTKKPQP